MQQRHPLLSHVSSDERFPELLNQLRADGSRAFAGVTDGTPDSDYVRLDADYLGKRGDRDLTGKGQFQPMTRCSFADRHELRD